jgi:hypothetical protein
LLNYFKELFYDFSAVCVFQFFIVAGVLKTSRKLEVQFVDFGNREVVANADVRDMPHTLLTQLPAQAIYCGLFGINSQSVSGWSPSDVDSFREIVDDQLLEVFFTRDEGTDGQNMVHLLKGEENLNRVVLRASSRLSVTYSSPVVSGKTGDNAGNQKGAGDGSICKRTNMGESRAGGKEGDKNDSVRRALKSGSTDLAVNVPVVQQIKFTYQSFEPNTVLQCYLAYVTSPSKFYCQLKNTADDLDKLMVSLNADSTCDKLGPVTVGQACCARYGEDERWYRAVIEQVNSQPNGIFVRFVDYGNEETVSDDCVKHIKAVYMKLPAQAIECSMDEVVAPTGNGKRWLQEACTKFEELFGDDAFEVRVICRNASGSVHYVNIDSVVEQMVSSGLAVRPKSAAYQRAADKTGSPATRQPLTEDAMSRRPHANVTSRIADSLRQHHVLKSDSLVSVTVSHVVSPAEFYCQLTESAEELDSMMEQIENDYSQLKETDLTIEKARVGLPCCAR